MKNQKGITLVALILIMLVLVILAGISISLVLTDNSKTNVQTPITNNTSRLQDRSNAVVNDDMSNDVLYDANGNPITTATNELENQNVESNTATDLESNTVENTVDTNTVSNEVSNENL